MPAGGESTRMRSPERARAMSRRVVYMIRKVPVGPGQSFPSLDEHTLAHQDVKTWEGRPAITTFPPRIAVFQAMSRGCGFARAYGCGRRRLQDPGTQKFHDLLLTSQADARPAQPWPGMQPLQANALEFAAGPRRPHAVQALRRTAGNSTARSLKGTAR